MYIYNVKWEVKTAGPSPHNNNRTELFLLGCKKASEGNPCKGCFNSQMWHIDKEKSICQTPYEVAKQLFKYMPNPHLTIGGGEPLDQIEDLIYLCKTLKNKNVHIIIYTWRYIKDILFNQYGLSFYNNFITLSKYVDAFIDGPYEKENHSYDRSKEDGFLNSIGSSNQHIVIVKKDGCYYQYELKNVKDFYYRDNLIIDGTEEKIDVYHGFR